MNTRAYLAGGAAVLILLLVFLTAFITRRRPRRLNMAHYQQRWQDAQGLLSSKNTWPLAIINADKVLDDALKRCRYKGKTMGERLVAAQHDLTDNDSVWYGHKLRNRIVHEDNVKLAKSQVKNALLGFRQALKDLGALK